MNGWRIIKKIMTDPDEPLYEGSEEVFQNGHFFIREDKSRKIYKCLNCGMIRHGIPSLDRHKYSSFLKERADNLTCSEYEALIIKDIIE